MTDFGRGKYETGVTKKYVWKQYEEEGQQVPPTINEYYTMLDVSGGIKIESVGILQNDNPESQATIEVRVTKDGVVSESGNLGTTWGVASMISMALIHTSNTTLEIRPFRNTVTDVGHFGFGNNAAGTPSDGNAGDYIECHAIKLEVRQTETVEAGCGLYWLIAYSKKEEVV